MGGKAVIGGDGESGRYGSGSSIGGGGLGNAASRDGLGNDLFSLATKVEALSKTVEGLSALVSSAAARRISIIESGMRDMDVRPWLPTEARIKFSNQFRSIPSVIVTISSVDIHNGSNFRVKVYATEVDLKGFTAHADSWGQTLLCSCGISWMAIGE
ncbi:hypothetical protein B0T16DRAFT_410547 [Cercophora newfieldiana]|uniref:H-type lectin domain-containing protein n=1 Tax=Cercophora newfieldiana TaxID=92897 RepID=A0AA39YCA6_9PEZI|nr:hypothetical protein B0T16DRAFT_410547 [Cercophora newfieldiana]